MTALSTFGAGDRVRCRNAHSTYLGVRGTVTKAERIAGTWTYTVKMDSTADLAVFFEDELVSDGGGC